MKSTITESASHPLARSSSGQPAAAPVMSVGAVKQEIPATTVTTNSDHNPSASAFLVSKALTAGTSASTAVMSSVYSAVSNGKTVPLEGGTNAGVRCEEVGVLGGTQAGEEMKAGLLGGEAAAGILGSTGTFSIEAAGRAAALADGVIRSDAPEHTQPQQLMARYPSVAQTLAAVSSGITTTVPASSPSLTAFNNSVQQHQAGASPPAGTTPVSTTGSAAYYGAHGGQRHPHRGQQASSATGHGFEGGYGRMHPDHRIQFQQAGAGGSFLGLACGGQVSHVQAKAQAQAQAQAETEVKAKKPNGLRRGKWTPEEEEYANRLIQEFKSGLLPLADGTTLRTFLSKLLNCDPMRISKKFVGSNCIGKQVFRRRQADMDRLQLSDIEKSRSELAELERRFLERVAMTNRCKTSGDLGAKEGHRELDAMRPHPPSSTTQPWMLPPDVGHTHAPSAPSVTIMAHTHAPSRVNLPSSSTSNDACAAVPLVSASVVTPVTPAPATVTTPPTASSPQSLNTNGGMEAGRSTAELSADAASKESAEVSSTKETTHSNSSNASERGTGSPSVSALGVNIDRTTSLEALSLLELPHLQGIPNLTVLGLGPLLPTSSTGSSAPLTMSSSTSPAKGVTSSAGFKREPLLSRPSSFENLQSLTEGPASSGPSSTETSGFGSSSTSAFMPRNTSVEDFLSLVESGDIPPPEGSAGFTVPMWIYGDDNKSMETTPPKSSPKRKSKGSSRPISVSGGAIKRLKDSST